MKNLFVVSIFLALFIGCETAPKTNGFVTSIENSTWQMGTQASVDLVVDLDKHWGVDYDKMRTFFADTVKGSFADGESFETLDGFIKQVKKGMEENPGEQNWTMNYAFCIDLDPTIGGDHVNAGFTVEATSKKPKRNINEWYYIKNSKIVGFNQSQQVVLD
tara:strand:+ start:156 stop:638 length:483 start_codon:yes stop_codon:yes gene_type:complete